jgi:hypothetical protein
MGSRYLTDLADVIRGAGLAVVEVGSGPNQTGTAWKTRARGSGGYDSGRPNHVMVHHTASNPSSDGWSDVNYQTFNADSKPIANLYLDRSGKVWVMAAGATNTNGSGADPCGVTPIDQMNSHAIGIEAANNGVGEQWPAAQQDAYVVLVTTLCEHYGIPQSRVHGHIEWAPGRKIDPAGPARWPPINSSGSWDMNSFRDDIGSTPPPPTQEDDPMRILQIMDVPGIPSLILTGHVASWIPTMEAFNAYKGLGIVPEAAAVNWLSTVVLTGPMAPACDASMFMFHVQ